jgi:hypothetical protein
MIQPIGGAFMSQETGGLARPPQDDRKWQRAGVLIAALGVVVAILALLFTVILPGAAHQASDVGSSKSKGPASAPASPRGHSSRSTPIAPASPQVYTNVPLMPLCEGGSCGGVLQVGNTSFTFTDQAPAGPYPDYLKSQAFPEFPGQVSSCSTMTVQFSGDSWANDGSPTTTDYLEFVQQGASPVYATVTSGQIGTVVVPLNGEPLFIDAADSGGGGVHPDNVDLNVTGTCTTPNGIPS